MVGRRKSEKKLASEIAQLYIDNPEGKHLVWLDGKNWPNADKHPDVAEWISYFQNESGPEFPDFDDGPEFPE